MAVGEKSARAAISRSQPKWAPGELVRSRRPQAHPWLRPALALIWPVALVTTIYSWVGKLGFSPTDEGLVQTGSFRILLGQVPHRDWIVPRPAFSAVIHTIDFAFPGSLFEVSRIITLFEFLGYAILLAWLIYDNSPWRWGWLAAAGAAASMLVNLHTFLLTSWYTIDGLVLVASGLLLIHQGVRRQRSLLSRIGFLLLGMALITKQSFFLAPVLGWVLLLPRLQRLPSRRLQAVEVLVTGLLTAAAGIVYSVWVGLGGGLSAMLTQLTSGSAVYGRELVSTFLRPRELAVLLLLVGLELLLLVAIERNRIQQPRGFPTGRGLDLGLRVLLSSLFIAVPIQQHLSFFSSNWGLRLVWMLVVFLAVRSWREHQIDSTGIVVLAMCWMAMLTWGLPVPNLVCGTLVLYVLHRTWRDASPALLDNPLTRRGLTVAGLASAVVIGAVFIQARMNNIYGDAPAHSLTASITSAVSAYGDIRTNPITAQYMNEITTCTQRYPAQRVAVLPANPAVYPALRLRNPFPIDWMFPQDFNRSYPRLVAAAEELDRVGDYLVLFQTQPGPSLWSLPSLPNASSSTPIFHYDDPHRTPTEIYARLTGRRIPCGSFIAVYSP
jgi:hypothetical protein